MLDSSSPYLRSLHHAGFVKITGLLEPGEVAVLRAACQTATAQARAGKWPHIRTLPKQFPPWPSTPGPEGIWGVQHLLHPDMPNQDVFASSYFHPKLLAVVEQILGVPDLRDHASDSLLHDEKLVMELYNLLVRPDTDFELRWHRDDIPPAASAEEEETALGIRGGKVEGSQYSHTQWNLALEPDDSLIVVPGTHKRARTQAERDAGIHEALRDQLTVHLEPGDVVFYDNNILHRGKYDSARKRYTLHGSIGKRGFTERRARNVLQHGVGKWISACSFSHLDEPLKGRAHAMKTNLEQMGGGGYVGFSQSD